MHVEIKSAHISSKPKIARLLQPYLSELAPFLGGSSDPTAIFEYPYLDAYWQEPDQRYPFLITVDREIAGFAFVNRHSRLGTRDIHCIAEFYVVPEFRRSGVGQFAAEAIFRLFPGKWEVAVLRGNDAAEQFWLRAIKAVASHSPERHQIDSWNGTIFTFTAAIESHAT